MTKTLAVPVAALALALLTPAAPASAAAPTPCPPSFQLVDLGDVQAELLADDQPLEIVESVQEQVFDVSDRNGDGELCQQVGSYGRAQGLPEFFSNFRDDKG